MAYLKQDELAAARGLMRSMCFSNDTVEEFLARATAGQISAVGELIGASSPCGTAGRGW